MKFAFYCARGLLTENEKDARTKRLVKMEFTIFFCVLCARSCCLVGKARRHVSREIIKHDNLNSLEDFMEWRTLWCWLCCFCETIFVGRGRRLKLVGWKWNVNESHKLRLNIAKKFLMCSNINIDSSILFIVSLFLG